MANNIHHTAIIGPNVTMGDGNYIGPYCIIGMPAEHKGLWKETPGRVVIGNNNVITGHVTIDAGTETVTLIGHNCFIMKHAHIGHDASIADEVTISCGAKIGGHAFIGSQSNIGLNAVIHQRKEIGNGVMIGMGAVVTMKTHIQDFQTYAGNPAKHIGSNKKYLHEGSSIDAQL
jgi:UDP-N-acetylglucosamine acyltransferase